MKETNKTNKLEVETTIDSKQTKPSNGLGKAGFILALIALFIGWIPILGWVIWLIGFVFSLMGIFKRPRRLALAGLIISLLGVLLLIFIFTGFVLFETTG